MELKISRRKRSLFIFFFICFSFYTTPLSLFSQPGDQHWKQHTLYRNFPDHEVEKIQKYFPDIVVSAHKINIPVPFVLAIIRAESNFNPEATSHKGALGLMQLMPATAKDVYGQIYAFNTDILDHAKLKQPELNIELGVKYLKYLEKALKGVKNQTLKRKLMIASYNAGITRVKRTFQVKSNAELANLVNKKGYRYVSRTLRKLPRETRIYLRRVCANYDRYKTYLAAA